MDFCKSDIIYFVENYVKIEDKDSQEIIVPFLLWEKQREALISICENRLNIVLKARQLGLTWLVLAFCAYEMLLNSGYTCIALSRTEEEAKELCRRLGVIVSNMPEFLKEECKENSDFDCPKYKVSATGVEISFEDGKKSVFKSFSSSKNAGRSFTANLLIIDEWAFQQFAREIWLAAFPTINRPNGGKVIGISTIERGTLFEELFMEKNDFNKIFLPWDTDPRRTAQWYDRTKRTLGDMILQEYPASVEEAMTVPKGLFFPEFKNHIHIVPEFSIPNTVRRYVSIDYGLDALAALWYAIDSQGNAFIYREVYKSGLIVSEAAKEILSANHHEEIELFFAPPDLWNANRDTGKSTAEIFLENGIVLTKTSNARVQGWLNVKEWLKPLKIKNEQTGEMKIEARLKIMEGRADHLVRCLKKIQKDSNNVNDTANHPHELTHLPDSLRAFCCGRTCLDFKNDDGECNSVNNFMSYD